VKVKPGQIFWVLDEGIRVGLAQFIDTDREQLDGDVLRVIPFINKKLYDFDGEENMLDAINSSQYKLSYFHFWINICIKNSVLEKTDMILPIHSQRFLFKGCVDIFHGGDYEKCKKWDIWEMNKPRLHFDHLPSEYRHLPLGLVFNFLNLPIYCRTGDFISKRY